LFDGGTFPGHPRFFGYICGAGAPLGALGDLLAATLNQNVSGWALSPLAHELEAQAIAWLAELVGYPAGGGLFVTGGNAANFLPVLLARHRRFGPVVRSAGVAACPPGRIYVSTECHTWIQKAADLYGLGTDAIAWIPVDAAQRIDVAALRDALERDRRAGQVALCIVGTAGTVSTGAVDPLGALAELAAAYGAWFHVDGSYGAAAALLEDPPAELAALAQADSVAVDAHKWFYAPYDVAATLVRDPAALAATFAYQPPYYAGKIQRLDGIHSYNAMGPDNSRGFRALKVWLVLQQVGRAGYRALIRHDARMARQLADEVAADPRLELVTRSLGITTFRYVPPGPRPDEAYLQRLNTALVLAIQASGRAFVSHAFVGELFVIRACVVNFRTTAADITALTELVVELGARLHAELAPGGPR
jgi:glutamate/tyrosine decarboxylase-like PLP-dependent enzyme